MKSAQGLDSITHFAFLQLSTKNPGYAFVGQEFLGGRNSLCGFVPVNWNGQIRWFTWKGKKELKL